MAKLSPSGGDGILLSYRGRKVHLDPVREPQGDFVFVSHAHFDHLPPSDPKSKVITSHETAFLAKERGLSLGSTSDEGEGFQLIDSGHILGSRSLLIDGDILYTGDVAGRARAFLGKGRPVKCSILIVESTYGDKDFRFPPIAKVLDEANRVIADLFGKGVPVILMGYPLGKAQVISYLFSSWEPVYVHGSVERMNLACSKLGVGLKEWKSYQQASEEGLLSRKPWILIAPMQSARSRGLASSLKKKYGAVTLGFTGWSANPSYRYAMGLDYALPLSDHCDFPDLVDYVRACDPEKVFTVHGFASEFASHLRKLGYDAEPVLGAQKSMTDYIEGKMVGQGTL